MMHRTHSHYQRTNFNMTF